MSGGREWHGLPVGISTGFVYRLVALHPVLETKNFRQFHQEMAEIFAFQM